MYHLTHRMMISWSKCRPLKRSCAEVGSVIPAVIAGYRAFQQFAPEPDIKVHLDTTAVEFLIDKGYDPTYGARPMRRAVEKYLEDPLAEGFLRGNIKQGDMLEVHAAVEQLAFKVTQPEQSKSANGSPLRSRG